jgi:cytolethal distending toxin subunit A
MNASRLARYAAVALLACSLPGAVPAAAAPPAPAAVQKAPTRFLLRNVNSGLCVTIAGGGKLLNQTAVQYHCDTHLSRQWALNSIAGTDQWFIKNVNSRLCLTIAGGNTGLNQTAVQYHCDTHPSRRWRLVPTGDGTNFIRNVNSGLCLTIAGGNTGLNQVAVQYHCDTHPSRRWTLGVA